MCLCGFLWFPVVWFQFVATNKRKKREISAVLKNIYKEKMEVADRQRERVEGRHYGVVIREGVVVLGRLVCHKKTRKEDSCLSLNVPIQRPQA